MSSNFTKELYDKIDDVILTHLVRWHGKKTDKTMAVGVEEALADHHRSAVELLEEFKKEKEETDG